jgi:hypothetical protein
MGRKPWIAAVAKLKFRTVHRTLRHRYAAGQIVRTQRPKNDRLNKLLVRASPRPVHGRSCLKRQ